MKPFEHLRGASRRGPFSPGMSGTFVFSLFNTQFFIFYFFLVPAASPSPVICVFCIPDAPAGPTGAGRLFLPASLLRPKIPILSEKRRHADVRNLSFFGFIASHHPRIATFPSRTVLW